MVCVNIALVTNDRGSYGGAVVADGGANSAVSLGYGGSVTSAEVRQPVVCEVARGGCRFHLHGATDAIVSPKQMRDLRLIVDAMDATLNGLGQPYGLVPGVPIYEPHYPYPSPWHQGLPFEMFGEPELASGAKVLFTMLWALTPWHTRLRPVVDSSYENIAFLVSFRRWQTAYHYLSDLDIVGWIDLETTTPVKRRKEQRTKPTDRFHAWVRARKRKRGEPRIWQRLARKAVIDDG